MLGDDGIKRRAKVHKQHLDVGVFLLQVRQAQVDNGGDDILCRAVGAVSKLERVEEGGGLFVMWLFTSLSKHFIMMGVSATGR